MSDEEDGIQSAQTWVVRFTENGRELCTRLTEDSELCAGSVQVAIPEDSSRCSQNELVQEIYRLGALEIAKKSRKFGGALTDQKAEQLASSEYLEGSFVSYDH